MVTDALTVPVAAPDFSALAAPVTAPAKRLSSAARSQQIVQEAVRFFAEVGFGGDTRELARRLGVTQSLIYKHFPSKDALIDRVYEEVYLGRWNPFWESVITDRSVPMQARLNSLYTEYAKAALTRDWVRIFMFSGLRGETINKKYLNVLRAKILEPLAAELRVHFGLPTVDEVALQDAEIELAWSMNARIFYFGQREWIFNLPLTADLDEMIHLTVAHFLAGAAVVLPPLVHKAAIKAEMKTMSKKARKNAEMEQR
jgi:AcrR family transcriptional regulator